jgi:hypothetical protein
LTAEQTQRNSTLNQSKHTMKTPGQINFEAFHKRPEPPNYYTDSQYSQRDWERAAQAVIKDYEQRQSQITSGGIVKPTTPLSLGPEVGRCSECHRCTWARSDLGTPCGMTQPDGSRCLGVFGEAVFVSESTQPCITGNCIQAGGYPNATITMDADITQIQNFPSNLLFKRVKLTLE